MNKKIETRALANSIREIKPEEGIVDAYLTAWGTVDSYKTTFQRGSFSKTFENRANKIRLLWNHDELAGKVLECNEDEYGPFVRVQFNLDTEVGRTAFAHCRAGDVDAFSFGFNVINDKWIDGIRTFTEVKVLECSPVLFPANEAAVITQVREEALKNSQEQLNKAVNEFHKSKRAESFSQTFDESELRSRGYKLFYALEETLDDIKYNNQDINEIIGKTDVAITEFHVAYMQWLNDVAAFRELDNRSICNPPKNDLQKVVRALITKEVIERTTLTMDDFKLLDKGDLLPIVNIRKLAELPEEIREAHHTERRKAVESLCNELREGGFTPAEKTRFIALLGISEQPEEIDETINFIKQFRKNLRG